MAKEVNMKTIIKITSWLFIFSAVLFSSACLQSETDEVQITLNNDLSGKLTIAIRQISSDEKTVAAQKKEMADFYADIPKTIQELKESGLKDPQIELTDKTDTRCGAVLKADFDSIATILPVLTDGKTDFEVSRTGDIVSIRMQVNGFSDDPPKLFSIKAAGEVLEHNAQSFDRETQTLQWKMGETGNRRVYLRIELPKSVND
jgi:hypothetical protein